MTDWREEEAQRRFNNDEAAKDEVNRLREQLTEIATVACTNGLADRGFHLSEHQTEQLYELLRRMMV